MSVIHAITVSHNGIAKQIRSNIRVFNGLTVAGDNWEAEAANAKEYTAIWDTGASSTAITQRVVDELGLSIVSKGITYTAAGPQSATAHRVHLWILNRVVIKDCIVSRVNLGLLGVDLLIGMNVICQGDFSISNYAGNTVMSFRIPSQERIDYIKSSAQGRNAPCPCGSGKKFKHCCGKNL
jgi:predicted aspartyl protease